MLRGIITGKLGAPGTGGITGKCHQVFFGLLRHHHGDPGGPVGKSRFVVAAA
jgi:hypothetical protein